MDSTDNLVNLAKMLMVEGKGLLAADWGIGSVGKRFEKISFENSYENRQKYREMLFSAPGLAEYISGVIQNVETNKQGFGNVLIKNGIMPGVKVDEGLVDMANFQGEQVSEGLDGLREKLIEHKKLGAVFCKFRTVFNIGDNLPSEENIIVNSLTQARYAALCQEQGMVPVVEPEVLMDGSHSLEDCRKVTEFELLKVFECLANEKVLFEGMILKTNMVISGKENSQKATKEEMAKMTVEVLNKCVPNNIAGVVFLSGGQSNVEATVNLNEIAKLRNQLHWPITFSYERAIEEPALMAWEGKDEKRDYAQKILVHRARMNSLASMGKYNEEEENAL